jgi:putative ABC transport system permease protein
MIPVSYNLRNLAVRRTTSFATAFGIGLVVFVLAAALMMSEGLRRTLDHSGSADTAIVMRKGADGEMASSINDSTVSIIRSGPGVATTSDGTPQAVGEIVLVLWLELASGDGKSNVQVRGVPDHVLTFRPEVTVIEGRPPKPNTDEMMVGKRIRGRFAGLDVGQEVELRKGRTGKVVGVFEADGASYESEVWGDVHTVRDAFGREGIVSSVRVRLDSPASFDGFAASLEQDKRLQLQVKAEPEFYQSQSQGTAVFITALGAIIAVFFSAGAMIGAMITMYGAVSNRQREIGVLRALGFSRTAILISFLFESSLLAMIGGGIGITAATALSTVEFSMMNWATFSEIVFDFQPTPSILVTSLIFGGVMGVVGGFLPALRAARVSAIDAMRS